MGRGGKHNRLPVYVCGMAESKGVVIAALIANAAIAVLKFVGFLLTASPAMLSETYHSISDTGNQVFLLIGIRFSQQEPTQQHPFGYGKAQFFYSFLVSVLLFGIAGWESLRHGYSKLTSAGHAEAGGPITFLGFSFDPSLPFDPYWVNVVVLLGAILFESYAFKKAFEELNRQMEKYGWSGYAEAFRQTSDVTTLTAFTEDAVALSGAAVALAGITLSRYTQNPVYDAAAAVIIGLLLMGFALALAWENKRLIMGEGLPESFEDDLREVMRNHDGVVHVDSMRTMFVGPQSVLVTADVSFDAGLDTDELDEDITQLEGKLRSADDRVKFVYVEPEV